MKFDISTLFWLFFIIVSLQPLLRKRFMVAMRQRLIATLEKAGFQSHCAHPPTRDDESVGFPHLQIH